MDGANAVRANHGPIIRSHTRLPAPRRSGLVLGVLLTMLHGQILVAEAARATRPDKTGKASKSSGSSSSTSGTLPRGPGSGSGGVAGPGSDSSTPGTATGPGRSCLSDISNPPGSNGQIATDGRSAWFFASRLATPAGRGTDGAAKAGSSAAAADAKRQSSGPRQSTLYKLSLEDLRAEPQLSLKVRSNAYLVTVGQPVRGVTAVQFASEAPGCADGPATLVSIALPTAKDAAGGMPKSTPVPQTRPKGGSSGTTALGTASRAVSAKGRFALVRGPTGLFLVEQDRRNLLELDVPSFQSRIAGSVPADERALWFEPATKNLVTWRETPRGLILYESGALSPTARLSILAGDRVLQAGDRFLISRFDLTANRVIVREIAKWTKVTRDADYAIDLPKTWLVADAMLAVSPDSRTILVQGSTPFARQRWQRAFVYDYGTGKLRHTVLAGKENYFEFAGIDSRGAYVVLETRNLESKLTVGAKVLQVVTGKITDVALPEPTGS